MVVGVDMVVVVEEVLEVDTVVAGENYCPDVWQLIASSKDCIFLSVSGRAGLWAFIVL